LTNRASLSNWEGVNSPVHEDIILVVEDDEDLRDSVCALLEVDGFRAVGVDNGLEALRYLQAHGPPCVILLDLMMPGMSGGEFRARQLADGLLARVPTIVLSAMHLSHQQEQVLNAAGYLTKPVNPRQLFQTVRQHCQAA
jgi:CheY-like chemotaxis protein